MSKLVDERIVEMGFDNKSFEKNVKSSIDTIDNLKSSLDFSGVSSSLLKVSEGFSTMEVAAIAAIADITTKVVDLGLELVNSLSIANIVTGWKKYAETSISVGTLVSQGNDIDTVYELLDKLSWYTDETSYSFTDMVSNISKFTAAGQDLDDSVEAMIGIANWAAMAGQNATTASRAMYQLAQSLAAGYVRLEDWKSIQTANMDTTEFRQTALDTAVALGTLTQAIDGSYTTLSGNTFDISGFTSYLTADGWLTTDVLVDTLQKYSAAVDDIYNIVQTDDSISTSTEAMKKYADTLDEFGLKAFKAAQEARTFPQAIEAIKEAASSKWESIFEAIFGEYDDATALWSDFANNLYDVFITGLDTAGKILDTWNELGGRNDLFVNTEEETGAFWNLFYALVAIKDLVANAWNIIFPLSEMESESDRISDITGKIKSFTEKLKELSENLYLSEEHSQSLTSVLKGAFSVLKAFTKIFSAIWSSVKPLLTIGDSLFWNIINYLGVLGESFTSFVATTDKFQIFGEKLSSILTSIIDEIKSFEMIKNVTAAFKLLISSFQEAGGTTENFIKIANGFKSVASMIFKVFKGLYEFIKEYIVPVLGSLLSIAIKVAGTIGGKLVYALAKFQELVGAFLDFLKISPKVQKFFETLKNIFTGIFQAIKNFLNGFKKADTGSVEDFTGQLISDFNPLTGLLKGLSDLFKGLWGVLKTFIPVLSKAVSFINSLLLKFANSLYKMFGDGSASDILSKIISSGFLIYAAKRIADIIYAFKSISYAITDVIGSFSEVVYSKAMHEYASALKEFAVGILILVAALILLGSIDDDQLQRSMTIMASLMALLIGIMAAMKSIYNSAGTIGLETIKTAIATEVATGALIKFVVAILIFSVVLKMLSELDPEQMSNGLTGIIMLMSVLLGAAKIISVNAKTIAKGTKGILSLAIAVLILSVPLKKIGEMDPKDLTQGLIGIGILLTLCAAYSKFSGKVEKSIKTAYSLIIFAEALLFASVPLMLIGSMGWEKVAVGLTGILGLSTIMLGLSAFSKYIKKSVKAAEAMVIISKALLIASLPMMIIAKLGWEGLSVAIVGLTSIVSLMIIISGISTYIKRSIRAAKAMVIISEALLIASIPLLIIGSMGWEKMAIGLTGLVGISAIMVVFGMAGKYMKNTIVTAVAMSIIGIALISFAISAAILGSMKWSGVFKAFVILVAISAMMFTIGKFITPVVSGKLIIFAVALSILSIALSMFAVAIALINGIGVLGFGKALLFLAGVFIVFGITSLILVPVAPIMLIVAGALFLMGEAVFMLAISLPILITSLGLLGSTIVSLIKLALTSLIELAPMLAEALAAIIAALFTVLIESTKSLFKLLDVVVAALIGFLWENGPAIISTVLMLLATFLVSLEEYFPTIAASIMSMVITLLEALNNSIATITDIVINILINLMLALKARLPELIASVVEMVVSIIEALVENILLLKQRIIDSAFTLILGLIEGLGQAIEDNSDKVKKTMVSFAQHLLNAFLDFFGMPKITSPSSTFKELGVNLIKGLIAGLKAKVEDTIAAAKSLGQSVLDTFTGIFDIHSPSKETEKMGKYLDQGLANGMDNTSKSVYSSAETLGNGVLDGLEDSGLATALLQIYEILNSNLDEGQLTIRPVMDLTDIQNGTNEIASMMSNLNGYTLNGSEAIANNTASSVNKTQSASNQVVSSDSAKVSSNEQPIVINNQFTINSDTVDPKEIATEIAEIMQTQINRRKVTYGKSTV